MSAHFSPCRTWRYTLTREVADPQFGCIDIDERDAAVTFVGLNPSTADETKDDPTIRRCVRFARDWGFTRLNMVNLFAYRATDPNDLFAAARDSIDVVGPENDHWISLTFGGSDAIIAAWGAPTPLTMKRVEQFAETFDVWKFHALGLTALGSPRHPLYMRADSQPVVFDVASALDR